MNISKLKYRFSVVLYVVLVVACGYLFFKQTRANKDETKDIRGRVKAAQQAPVPHPLLVSNYRHNMDYIRAIELIEQSDYQRIWAVSDFLDPTFVVNYYIYPRRLVMSEEMQRIVNFGRKIMQEEIGDYRPSRYDGVLEVQPGRVRLADEWELSR